MADSKKDPTVRHRAVPGYPEGTHPPHPPAEQTWGPYRFSYGDMPDDEKPDKSTVAQVIEKDPVREAHEKALADSAAKAGREANEAARSADDKADKK